jgi:hypothetical protein
VLRRLCTTATWLAEAVRVVLKRWVEETVPQRVSRESDGTHQQLAVVVVFALCFCRLIFLLRTTVPLRSVQLEGILPPKPKLCFVRR